MALATTLEQVTKIEPMSRRDCQNQTEAQRSGVGLERSCDKMTPAAAGVQSATAEGGS